MHYLRYVAKLLVVIGALNWGLVGFFHYDLVSGIFGEGSAIARIIFALVGLSGLYMISMLCRGCCGCSGEKSCGCHRK